MPNLEKMSEIDKISEEKIDFILFKERIALVFLCLISLVLAWCSFIVPFSKNENECLNAYQYFSTVENCNVIIFLSLLCLLFCSVFFLLAVWEEQNKEKRKKSLLGLIFFFLQTLTYNVFSYSYVTNISTNSVTFAALSFLFAFFSLATYNFIIEKNNRLCDEEKNDQNDK